MCYIALRMNGLVLVQKNLKKMFVCMEKLCTFAKLKFRIFK